MQAVNVLFGDFRLQKIFNVFVVGVINPYAVFFDNNFFKKFYFGPAVVFKTSVPFQMFFAQIGENSHIIINKLVAMLDNSF